MNQRDYALSWQFLVSYDGVARLGQGGSNPWIQVFYGFADSVHRRSLSFGIITTSYLTAAIILEGSFVAWGFCIVVTANFRMLYAFVLIEHGTRRLIHSNVTANPTADWARQQIREAIPSDHNYRFLIHDRDCIFSTAFDKTITNLGIKPIKTPRQSPKANAICERVFGTLRRECLDYVIPLSERHLRRIMKLWITHYNCSRPHSSIGPNIPSRVAKPSTNEVRLPRNIKPNDRIIAIPILGGLHHDYQFAAA